HAAPDPDRVELAFAYGPVDGGRRDSEDDGQGWHGDGGLGFECGQGGGEIRGGHQATALVVGRPALRGRGGSGGKISPIGHPSAREMRIFVMGRGRISPRSMREMTDAWMPESPATSTRVTPFWARHRRSGC